MLGEHILAAIIGYQRHIFNGYNHARPRDRGGFSFQDYNLGKAGSEAH